MSGIHGQILGHLVRRGVEAAGRITPGQAYLQSLQKQAQLYEDAGPENEVQFGHLLIIAATAVLFTVVYASVRYTLGEVVASLAMIEQPTTTVIVSERKIDDKSDPDAPFEKEPLMVDEEVTVIREEPITGSLKETIRHLQRVGGFRARWRGLGVSIIYHMVHGAWANILAGLFSHPLFSPLAFLISSVLFCRLHATWTHIMISQPSALPWYKRIVRGPKAFKTLAMPSLVFALAQQLVIIMPILVWTVFGDINLSSLYALSMAEGQSMEQHHVTAKEQKLLALRVLVTISTAAATAILILLPAAVTLTRIEASLLPDDQETIVSFDRSLGGAVTSDINVGTISTKSLFVEAWRSFDRPSRLRLVKFYVKMYLVQIHIVLLGFIAVVAEIALIGPESLGLLVQSGSAQLQLAAMGIDGN